MHIPSNTVSSLSAPSPQPAAFTTSNSLGGLVDIFSDLSMQQAKPVSYVPPKQVRK